MKTTLRAAAAAAVSLALATPITVTAQSPAPAAGQDAASIQKLRERLRADRKAVVAEGLALTDAEAKAFWPAYEKCQPGLDAAHRKSNRAILDYVNGESSMTDALAKKLAKDLLEAETSEVRARRGCYEAAAKVLSPKKAARYLQIESKIHALSRYDMAAAIPLLK